MQHHFCYSNLSTDSESSSDREEETSNNLSFKLKT
jgi:hypothetical protein